MKMLKNLKNKKGFTLIEIVIVIVIIAILAAMLVPSLLKWIDNANQKSFLEAANTIKTSCLSVLTDNYASSGSYAFKDVDWGESGKISELVGKTVVTGETALPDKGYKATVNLATSGNKLETLVVENANYTATWTESDGQWEVAAK